MSDVRVPQGVTENAKSEERKHTDIRHAGAARFAPRAQSQTFATIRKKRHRSPVFWFFLATAVFVIGSFFSFYSERGGDVLEAYGDFRKLQGQLGTYSLLGDKGNAAVPERGFEAGEAGAGARFLSQNPFAAFGAVFGGGGELLKSVARMSGRFGTLLSESAALEETLPDVIIHRKGEETLDLLRRVRDAVSDITSEGERATAIVSRVGGNYSPTLATGFLPIAVELKRLQDFLTAFLVWAGSDEEKHIAVFFGNTSEIRPGGGFVGSYAEVGIRRGAITTIAIRDVSDADRLLDTRIVPPEPLQLIVKNWRAADANWFFDFRDSAKKTLEFLENSEYYRKQKRAFDGAIAITPAVVSDILKVVGPISDGTENPAITSENFLTELQRRIERGRAAGTKNPKDVVAVMGEAVGKKLSTLTTAEKKRLYGLAQTWLGNKDVVIYHRFAPISSFIESSGWTGSLSPTPASYYGDYFALVGATIGTGKTELFVDKKIVVKTLIGGDGLVTNNVLVVRSHGGGERSEWWYRTTNRAYIKIFTPASAHLINVRGGRSKSITAPLKYDSSGYQRDSAVSAVEKTARDFIEFPSVTSLSEYGKNVFATWLETDRGKTTEFSLDYAYRLPYPPRDSGTYEFTIDKQIGDTSAFRVEIGAPVGYVWKENGKSVYEYETDTLPATKKIILTFKKL